MGGHEQAHQQRPRSVPRSERPVPRCLRRSRWCRSSARVALGEGAPRAKRGDGGSHREMHRGRGSRRGVVFRGQAVSPPSGLTPWVPPWTPPPPTLLCQPARPADTAQRPVPGGSHEPLRPVARRPAPFQPAGSAACRGAALRSRLGNLEVGRGLHSPRRRDSPGARPRSDRGRSRGAHRRGGVLGDGHEPFDLEAPARRAAGRRVHPGHGQDATQLERARNGGLGGGGSGECPRTLTPAPPGASPAGRAAPRSARPVAGDAASCVGAPSARGRSSTTGES